MADFKISNNGYIPMTCIPDNFIENFMPTANGDYVKIYLYILYCAKKEQPLSISSLADTFQCTENDIKRALKYWESKSLLSIEETISEEAVSPALTSVPEKQSYSAGEMKHLKEQEEVRLLLVACEAYLQKQMTRTDVETLLYFYEQLHFSTDLIEYLVQYSVSKNKKSFRYMEAVAIEWHKKGIKTVEEARLDSKPFSKECYMVLKALGINNHDPLPAEINYVKLWMQDYGFTIDIILEACSRTMMRIHKPHFEYVDGILKKWRDAGVHHLSDIEKLTAEHKNQPSDSQEKTEKAFTTRFHNFQQRSYDFEELEKKLFINQ